MTQMITRLNPPSLPDAGALGYFADLHRRTRAQWLSSSARCRKEPSGEPAPASLVEQAGIVISNARACAGRHWRNTA